MAPEKKLYLWHKIAKFTARSHAGAVTGAQRLDLANDLSGECEEDAALLGVVDVLKQGGNLSMDSVRDAFTSVKKSFGGQWPQALATYQATLVKPSMTSTNQVDTFLASLING